MGESQQLEKRLKDMTRIEFALRYRAGRPTLMVFLLLPPALMTFQLFDSFGCDLKFILHCLKKTRFR